MTKRNETRDPVNHPSHYTSTRFPFECIELTSRMDFCTGNMVKYVWRHLDKGKPLEDLKKARFYLNYENYELGYTNGRIIWSASPDMYDKLHALANPSNHYDYQPFWAALVAWNTQTMLAWLDYEITLLEAYQ